MTDLEKKIVEKQPFKDLVVERAEFDQAFIMTNDNQLQMKPFIGVDLTCEGRKKKVRRDVMYSFCPFCGKAYEDKKEVER